MSTHRGHLVRHDVLRLDVQLPTVVFCLRLTNPPFSHLSTGGSFLYINVGYTNSMITKEGLRNYPDFNRPDSRDIIPFLNTYYKEMQLWGVYLSDIEFHELNAGARQHFLESAFVLWKKARSK